MRLPTAAVAMFALLTTTGFGAPQVQLPTKRVLTLEAVKRVADAAEAEARANGWAVSIAIVDDSGQLLLFERMDAGRPCPTAEPTSRRAPPVCSPPACGSADRDPSASARTPRGSVRAPPARKGPWVVCTFSVEGGI